MYCADPSIVAKLKKDLKKLEKQSNDRAILAKIITKNLKEKSIIVIQKYIRCKLNVIQYKMLLLKKSTMQVQ